MSGMVNDDMTYC